MTDHHERLAAANLRLHPLDAAAVRDLASARNVAALARGRGNPVLAALAACWDELRAQESETDADL